MLRRLEYLSSEERLRLLRPFRLEKKWFQGDPMAAFWYLEEVYRKDGKILFTRDCSDSKRVNGFKLKEGRFHWAGGRCPCPWQGGWN